MLSLTQSLVASGVALSAILYPSIFASPAFSGAKIWTIFLLASVIALFYATLTALFCSSVFVSKLHGWLGKIPLHRIQKWFERKEPQFLEFNADLRALRGIRPILGATGAYTLIWIFENIETLIILAFLGSNLTIPQALLMEVKAAMPGGFSLFTRAGNARARRFYEKAGLIVLREAIHPKFGDAIVYYRWKIRP